MSWYHAQNGEKLGPISESEFHAAVSSGTITGETLVWRDGMSEWKKFKDVGVANLVAAGPIVSGTFGSATCAECGQHFPQDEMVQFGENWVCGGCKPVYVQKLKEGVHVGHSFEYAGFWIRFVAKIIDYVLLWVAYFGISTILALLMNPVVNSQKLNWSYFGASYAVWILIWISYCTFFLGKYGATPGKMMCKLKVIRPDGSPLTFGRAFGRYWAGGVSSLTLFIGYLIAAWDSEKRALHDRIADTRVIRGG